MAQIDSDVVVIGGGIAGVSIGYELASDCAVTLLEAEPTLAYHTTGRSAATFLETFGDIDIRALTTAGRDFLTTPPDCFHSPLMTPGPQLTYAAPGNEAELEEHYREVVSLVPAVELVSAADIATLVPYVRDGAATLGLYDPSSMAVDVDALHSGFVRGMTARGGRVYRDSRVVGCARRDGLWQVSTSDSGEYRAPIVVNAAGAWADAVGALAGAVPIGLQPKRRTAFMVACPDGLDTATLPLFGDLDYSFYIKPEATQLLCSPGDETPVPPHDAKPDELAIAQAIEQINETTTLNIRSIRSPWAGLRSFTADHRFVVGEDPRRPGFFWCAGQGGYGIQTSPATARLGASLVRGEPVPADIAARGLDAAMVSPQRFA
ncbi:FAD-dependent oxidoreductase [Gordonia amarae]|uniref:FAD-dependent oxidoreductase n=2 Tax=Gordonia amarae TaxID=36821 RepID=A0A857L2T5_9ACTN|nr:FAD-dependent oxidoreductase [Gordonia amarae]MCS3876487.1 D-arginine dehydrogenase [Gordonia amarae]QHN19396.1 FAD-dependent oxidoreductase [Gordonia amarae]QHN23872.1 FAD-dependent oxidoreductase [Gordonia amarae]QHN32782.1 FAD-dependent oxidoreductase [Gordonia amarae]QHN41501.1 FAD-dependent oxidoreductase [Gordonia amarae]